MSKEQYLHDARRKDAEAERFGGGAEAPAAGIDKDGHLGGDPDAEAAAQARQRRRAPVIPGARISKAGKPLTHAPPRGTPGWKKKGAVHPRRRQHPAFSAKGNPWGGPWRHEVFPAWAMPAIVEAALGQGRVRRLRVGLLTKGATLEERRDRVYLAVLLDALDDTAAQKAAAVLLLGTDDEPALRKLRELRGRLRQGKYQPELVERAMDDFRALLGQQTAYGRDHR
jgi:hypothetical protein